MVGRSRGTDWYLVAGLVGCLALSVAAALRGDTATAMSFAVAAVVAAWVIRRGQRPTKWLLRETNKFKVRAYLTLIMIAWDIFALGFGIWATVEAIQASGDRQGLYAIVAAGLFICGAVFIYYTVLVLTVPILDAPDTNSPGQSDDTTEPQH